MEKKSKSDGCTLAFDLNFRHCCEQHDSDYTAGSGVSRREADRKLFHCIRRTKSMLGLKYVVLPFVYWSFVRVFGRFFYQKNGD